MLTRRCTHSARSFASLWRCLAVAAATWGCDSGSSYADDEDADPGTGAGNQPSDVPGMVLPSLFGNPQHVGQGSSSDRWHKTPVQRDSIDYFFMANGWGPNFESQSVSWYGTTFTVESMLGRQ